MKILGIGNSLVDLLSRVKDESVISRYGLNRGGMTLINSDVAVSLTEEICTGEYTHVAGGSAANTISGIKHLGVETGFVGKIGKDEVGDYFEEDLKTAGVETQMLRCNEPTGRCVSLITPDGERSMATYLGATGTLDSSDFSIDMFSGYDLCHIGGYLVQNSEMIETVMKLAKEAGCVVSLDLASYNIVDENYDLMHKLVSNYVDIVFANEEESKSYTGLEPEESVSKIAEDCEIAVVKVGSKGVWVMRKDEEKVFEPALTGRNCIDTTGAGDLFASGFLYAYSCGMSVKNMAKAGNIVGANIVEHIGTKMPDSVWNEISSQIRSL